MNADMPTLYREEQRYAELPPFILLVAVGTLFGWFLIVWVVGLGRSLGALELPPAVALGIGLPLGILLPLAYFRLRMVTEVYQDRVQVYNAPFTRLNFPYDRVTGIDIRTDYIREDYDHRQVGREGSTNIAYTVAVDTGVQLTLTDGRNILIGSKQPEQLGAILSMAWRAARSGQPMSAID